MSGADNKALLDRYVDVVWAQGRVEALDDFLSPAYRRHLTATAEPLDLDGQKRLLAGFRSAFPDAILTIEDALTEGDRIAFRSTMRGTHQGPFQGIEPTNREVMVALLDIVRVENGKFVEQWGGPNLLDLLHQLGANVTTQPATRNS